MDHSYSAAIAAANAAAAALSPTSTGVDPSYAAAIAAANAAAAAISPTSTIVNPNVVTNTILPAKPVATTPAVKPAPI